jgi:NAD(P)-dependent dehydrogenase (short-subunit alcohol dehydrogenase family)
MPVALITGANRGLGLATAIQLARHGHCVVATMRDLGAANDLREAAAVAAVEVHTDQLDVTDPASVDGAVARSVAEHGPIDVLVNNAAVVDFSAVEDITDERARDVFETNLFGPLRTIRAVLPAMRARHRGTIVNVSSIGGRMTPFCTGLYTMSKHALEAASELLAMEVRPYGIRVAVVEPGFFATRMVDDATAPIGGDPASPYADAERRICAWFAQSRPTAGDPADVGAAIAAIVAADEPRFRHPVGADAAVYIDGRRRLSDETWIDLGRAMTDEEFFAEFAARFAPSADAVTAVG